MNNVDWPTLLTQLVEPFPQEAVRWRVGAVSRDKKRAQALPYAEPRVYEDRLNAVCPGDWSCSFLPWNEHRIICELTIHGVKRSSTGEESDGGFAPGTAAEAQAFKRACSKFGLGRYLYDIGIDWLEYDDEKKRLVKTPQVSAKFLPESDKKAVKAPAKPETLTQTLPETTAPLLEPARAEAMAKELEKLGIARPEQLKLATHVLGHPVRAFTQLTEAEALEVWAAAKRLAKPVVDEPKPAPAPVPWKRWQTPEDAIMWADDQLDEHGKKIFNTTQHAENSYNKAKREHLNSLPKGAKQRHREFWCYWFQKVEAKKLGQEYVLPTHGSQRLIDNPIGKGDGLEYTNLN